MAHLPEHLRQHRVELLLELRFTEKEANELAQAEDSQGRIASMDKIRRALKQGATHRQVHQIFR